MKVLWFSLSPCGAIKRNNIEKVDQGWMISLENEIKKKPQIQLSVAYISYDEKNTFKYDGVTYYPIHLPKSPIPVVRILERLKSISYRDNKILPKMLEIINTCKPDLIHIHGTEECFGLIQNHIQDIPIAFSIQGLIAPYAQKYFSGISKSDIIKREKITEYLRCISTNIEYRKFKERGERECNYLKNAKYIFGRTFWDREITGLLNPDRKYYVINEILRKPFYSKIWIKDCFNSKLKIVSTISGGAYKGYETVLKSAKLLKEYSNIDFEWHIAGYTHKSKWLKITEKTIGIKSDDVNIVLHGRLNAEDLSSLLIECDIYVQVSHIENSPNSVCEAMLVGMPVIASYAGGTCSLIENEKEGLLVQDGDPYVLSGAIVRVQNDFAMSKQWADNARIKASQRHNPQAICESLLLVYDAILSINH